MAWRSFVAMGDSFTEGMNDAYPDGTYRGWADLVAARLALDSGPEFGYANLAIRGKLLDQVINEQLGPTLAMRPDLVSFAAGGNDALRPRMDPAGLIQRLDPVVARLRASGADVILFRFADVASHLPGQRIVRPRAAVLNDGASELAERHGAYVIDLFGDQGFHHPHMWSADRLHLSPAGHRRVAGHVLAALGVGVDEDWMLVPPHPEPTPWLLARGADLRWAREHLTPLGHPPPARPIVGRRRHGEAPRVGPNSEVEGDIVTSMSVANDPAPTLQAYAHPDKLVTTEWLAANLGTPGLVVVESDEDVLLYESGHIPGAVKVDWHLELNDQLTRDYLDPAAFAALCEAKGIGRDDTIVFYGDNFNWWAAYALWVFSLFGHRDVRLLDGGRQKWAAEGRELTRDKTDRPAADYPAPVRDDSQLRAFRDQVMAHIAGGRPLVDVRSPQEYTGELTHMAAYPQEGALRGGHIPGALSKPWKSAANDDGTFKAADELTKIYAGELGLETGDDVIAYCRIGERSSHTWFVLHHLLGYPQVRNYDGSWTEWGNLVRAPIARGTEPGGLS